MSSIRKAVFIFSIHTLFTGSVYAFDLRKAYGLSLDTKLDQSKFSTVTAEGKKGMLFVTLKTETGAFVYVKIDNNKNITRILVEQKFNTIRECSISNEKSQKELKSINPNIGYYAMDDSDMYYINPHLITFSCEKRKNAFYLIVDRWNEKTNSQT